MDVSAPLNAHLRLARADDDEFILGMAERFVEGELPAWRKRKDALAAIRDEIARHLRELPPASHLFVAESDDGERLGFVHLLTQKDTQPDTLNCHINYLIVAPRFESRGVGGALLAFAESWAKEHRCRHVTLNVFPANARAQALYARHGYGVEKLRMAKPVR